MSRYLLGLSLGVFILSGQLSFAAPVVRISAEELPKLVRERNQNVTGSAVLTESARARKGYLTRSFLPVLRAEFGGESFQTGPYATMTQPYGGVEARVNLFRGGKDSLEEQVRGTQVGVSEASAKKSLETELSEARKVYWELVFTHEMLMTLNLAIEQNEKYLEMANRRITRGLSTETDRLEFQIHKDQLQEDAESLTHELMLLQIQLSAVLGMEDKTQFQTETIVPHIHDEALLGVSFDSFSHPEVKSLKANQEATSFQRIQASRWWAPSVDAYTGAYLYTLRDRDYLNQDTRDDYVVGLRLTFELFDGFQSKAQATALSLQADALELQATQRARSIHAQVEVAKEELKHDHELIHTSETRIEQGKKYLARTLEEYARGVKNSIDVLGSVQRLVGFQKQNAERRQHYQMTKSSLQALLGQ